MADIEVCNCLRNPPPRAWVFIEDGPNYGGGPKERRGEIPEGKDYCPFATYKDRGVDGAYTSPTTKVVGDGELEISIFCNAVRCFHRIAVDRK